MRTNPHGCVVDVVWSPPFEGPVVTDTPEDMDRFYRAYTRWAQLLDDSHDLLDTVRLAPGEVLTFNNRRMLHGRTPFRLLPGTRRHLKVGWGWRVGEGGTMALWMSSPCPNSSAGRLCQH